MLQGFARGVIPPHPYTALRLVAEFLPRSVVTSKLTFCPSASVPRPERSTALMWTNTSLEPSLGAMKPQPLPGLNHLTVPVAILASLMHIEKGPREKTRGLEQPEVSGLSQ